MSGTPYIAGGNSPAGTDCSGLASWTSNVASGRPAFSGRFHTANEESALLSRGFQYGTAPGALVIGWNSYHTAVTLPDGTPVSSGESGGGVRVGGGGAYQPQFTHHMFLPVDTESSAPEPAPEPAELAFAPLPAPPPDDAPPPGELPPPADFLVAPDAPPPPFEPPAEPPAFEPPAEGEPAPPQP